MRVVIAGGGTGGHLFPGIALAEEILGRGKNEVLFVGTERGLEARLVPQAGYALRTIDVSGLKRAGAGGLLRGLLRLPRALAQSRRILREFDPDLVVGVGGYSSGPMVLAAALRRLPTAILEQNSIPGITNRMLGRVARRAFIAFDASRRFFPARKTALLGNPIRRRLRAAARPEALATPTLLVVGGSQGAHALNELAADAMAALAAAGGPVPRLCHQTGEADAAAMAGRYQALRLEADVRPFIDDMERAYASADLVLCRAGATTIAELSALGLPAIFLPFPFAADDHQYWNAKALADAGAALCFRQGEIDGAGLARVLADLLGDRARLGAMSEAMRAFGKPDAARAIVDALEELVKDVPRA